jgi:phage host-nuclease inhibitor protein Gam
MTEESAPSELEVRIPANMDEVVAFVNDLIANDRKIAEAIANEQAAITPIAALRATIVDPLNADNAVKSAGIREYFLRNKISIRSQIGKTIPLSNGVVKWFVRERTDLPKDTGPVISFLLKRRFGRRILEQKFAVKKNALKTADPRLLKILRERFDVFVGDVEHLTLAIETRKDPIPLHEERLARRAPRH